MTKKKAIPKKREKPKPNPKPNEPIPKAKEVEVKQGPIVSKEELAKMFREEMDRTIEACRKELYESNKRILEKYQCNLEVTMTLTPRGNIPNISVVPRPPKQ